jgi:hypothetical protein
MAGVVRVPAHAQVASIKQVAQLNVELTMDERNLLSVGYKHVICL